MINDYEDVPVVFALDDGYAMPTAIAIYSLLKHYKSNRLEIVFLFKNSLSELTKFLLHLAVQSFENTVQVKLSFIDVENRVTFPDSHISHITSATYYRLVLPELLCNAKKCLYLDGDIYVNSDISELLEIEFQNNELIAGVRSTTTETAMEFVKRKKRQELGIQDLSGYINAGVILMNLESMRNENIESKMLDLISKNFRVQDQDIINVACYGRIKNIQPKFNALPDLFKKSKRFLAPIYSSGEISEAKSSPCIIHYADSLKPWKFNNVANVTRWREAYFELLGGVCIQNQRYGIRNKCVDFEKFVIRHMRGK